MLRVFMLNAHLEKNEVHSNVSYGLASSFYVSRLNIHSSVIAIGHPIILGEGHLKFLTLAGPANDGSSDRPANASHIAFWKCGSGQADFLFCCCCCCLDLPFCSMSSGVDKKACFRSDVNPVLKLDMHWQYNMANGLDQVCTLINLDLCS